MTARTRLSHRDIQAVGEFLTRCRGAADVDEYARQVLSGIATLVPAVHSSFNLFDQRRQRVTWVEHPHEAPPFEGAAAVLSAHFHEHPVVQHFLAEPADPTFVKISDFVSDREFAKTAIYNEYYRRRGIRHQISIMLPGRAGPRIAIALNRDRRDFTERDRQVLDLLPPHLVAAHRNAVAFGRAARALALLERGLDIARIGLVVLGTNGEPVLITAGASRLLDAYYGARRARGLPDAVGRWLAKYETPLRDELPPLPRPLVTVKGERRLCIRLRLDENRRALVLEERTQEVSRECLMRLGLSERQAEVLRWVAAGKTDHEIATILALSPRTVHHHVEHTYRTLGVENRTAAARIAMEAAEG